ncbi:hypothetical protein EPD60_15125 [Flaviaesturariibacter flavus]|uniref:Uncharacterized protein n=1 Tax=Flaviaesturariibacter flavus TaxID=2502780 RepID=A0A4R1B7N1_9BACT|nr:hypothetical protein [Flaviaesturariibacter flavus]TCJ12598.1 hypothetical protein EPD60_15125 [Flaviaesturariibacter flavus]
MNFHKPNITLHLLFLLCLLSGTGNVFGQAPLSLRFIKDTVVIDGNGFQFNSLRMENTGSAPLPVTVSLQYSDYLQLVTPVTGERLLAPGEIQYQPLHLALRRPHLSAAADTVWVHCTAGGSTKSASFVLREQPYIRWSCTALQSEVLYSGRQPNSSVEISLQNSGNVPLELQLSSESPPGVTFQINEKKPVLAPGERRVFRVPVVLQTRLEELRTYGYLFAQDATGDKRMIPVNFIRTDNIYSQGVERWEKMPLSVDLNLRNFTGSQPALLMGASGNLSFSKDRRLDVLLSSPTYFQGYQLTPQQGHLLYSTARSRTLLGYQNEFRYFTAFGLGANVQLFSADKKGTTELGFIRHYLNEATTSFISLAHPLARRWNWSSQLFYNSDRTEGTRSLLNMNEVAWEFAAKQKIGLRFGGGGSTPLTAKAGTDSTVSSGLIGYTFDKNWNRWQASSRLDVFGKHFPGMYKNFTFHDHELRRAFGKKLQLSAFYRSNVRVYNQSVDAAIRNLMVSGMEEYGIGFSGVRKQLSFNSSFGIFRQWQDSLSAFVPEMYRLSNTLNFSRNGFSLYFTSQAGIVRLRGRTDIAPYFAVNSSLNIQYGRAGLQLQHCLNPYYYYEIKESLPAPRSYRRLQFAPYYEHFFPKIGLSIFNQYSYTLNSSYGTDFSFLTTRVSKQFPAIGLQVMLNNNAGLRSNRAVFTDLTIRKSLSVPVYKKRKSYNFDLVLFRDRDNDQRPGAGDEPLAHADVLVNGNWVRTDSTGTLSLRDIGAADLDIDFSKIKGIRGWLPRDGLRQKLNPARAGKQMLVPFRIGRLLRGRLVLIADNMSNQHMELSSIRVTATDAAGKSFSTLTDMNSEFSLELPGGSYQVTLNENVFDDEYVPVTTSRIADLNGDEPVEIVFEVMQRKRSINIRRTPDNGQDEERDEEEPREPMFKETPKRESPAQAPAQRTPDRNPDRRPERGPSKPTARLK